MRKLLKLVQFYLYSNGSYAHSPFLCTGIRKKIKIKIFYNWKLYTYCMYCIYLATFTFNVGRKEMNVKETYKNIISKSLN